VTHNEIKTYQGARQPYERTFRLLKKVPLVRWDELLGMHSHGDRYTWITSPIVQTDPLYGKLHALGVRTTDAQHLFVAAKNGCEVFLTCDKGVLARRDTIKTSCGVTVQKPSEFVAEQGW
jgi:hypothetical protein